MNNIHWEKKQLPYIGFYNPATVQTYLVGCSAIYVDLNFQPRIWIAGCHRRNVRHNTKTTPFAISVPYAIRSRGMWAKSASEKHMEGTTNHQPSWESTPTLAFHNRYKAIYYFAKTIRFNLTPAKFSILVMQTLMTTEAIHDNPQRPKGSMYGI